MDIYINKVFDIVIGLYKDAAPELIAEAFRITTDDVKNLSSQEIKEKLNNMIIDYKLVDKEDEKHICYSDKIIKNNRLIMHLYEPEVIDKKDINDISSTKIKRGVKIISDINYISHEMAHAFEHSIHKKNKAINPYKAYRYENSDEIIDSGEAFAISMERIIFDELKKKEQLSKYNITEYEEEIENLWKIRTEKDNNKNVVKDINENNISLLDLELIPYRVIKEKGFAGAMEDIKTSFDKQYIDTPSSVRYSSKIQKLLALKIQFSKYDNRFKSNLPVIHKKNIFERIKDKFIHNQIKDEKIEEQETKEKNNNEFKESLNSGISLEEQSKNIQEIQKKQEVKELKEQFKEEK